MSYQQTGYFVCDAQCCEVMEDPELPPPTSWFGQHVRPMFEVIPDHQPDCPICDESPPWRFRWIAGATVRVSRE